MSKNTKEYHKAASRKHYLANKAEVIARSKAAKVELLQYVKDIKEKTPCVDCGNNYPYYVMDFDHLPGFEKCGEINVLAKLGSRKRVIEEMAKCDLVCSNCHRIRTYTRRISSVGLEQLPSKQ